eukprot:g862.t1
MRSVGTFGCSELDTPGKRAGLVLLLTAQFETRATVPAGTIVLSVLSLSGLGSCRILQILLLPNFENSNRFPIILGFL